MSCSGPALPGGRVHPVLILLGVRGGYPNQRSSLGRRGMGGKRGTQPQLGLVWRRGGTGEQEGRERERGEVGGQGGTLTR